MYYTYPCPVCEKIFFAFSDYQTDAAQKIYNGIENHMKDYNELEKGTDNLDHPGKMYQDYETVYQGLSYSPQKPVGAYDVS